MYKEALVEFMYQKSKKLSEELDLLEDYYFNDMDREAILSWSEYRCKEIWDKICRSIKVKEVSGLVPWTCPFCLKYPISCDPCEYAANHLPCMDKDSTYRHIQRKETQMKKIIKDDILTNDFYKETINKICKLINDKDVCNKE